ncbi:Shedu immune nuclease family protein [Rhodococcus sp. JVH1]|uniref:Shedu immune nuclease family protein n=1 Tax=Rhodococcus sp. JVH1 TaxID=745408 RepID=UPI000271EA2E|nr:Shedu immune nuclease family protein [Rhodococcus sp. JVH1]EJI98628.1 hypothetical protein JVH1_3884 [Rhodococcus sp. JVH1]
MVRYSSDQDIKAELDVRRRDNEVDGFFVPLDTPTDDPGASNGVRILNFSGDSSELRIFPINTFPDKEKYLQSRYPVIRTLTIALPDIDIDDVDFTEILEYLPNGFRKTYKSGLGLLKDCNRLVRLIEEHTECDEIYFMGGTTVAVDGKQLLFGLDRFEAILSEIRRINSRGNDGAGRVKNAFVHNELASTFGLEPAVYSLGRHPVSQVLTKAAGGVTELTKQEQDALLDTFASESAVLARTRPESFVKLHRDVELVSLDLLIASYEDAMASRKKEGFWQNFFDDNSFALQQVFGVPMVHFQSSASVGGVGFDGSGEKIADYMFKNPLTNNVALVELKKPATSLLTAKPYRGGAFGPSKELAGAVTQVMDQANRLMITFASKKVASRVTNLEAYAVSCFVVIGRTPSSDDEKKSFEMYRGNSRSVKIVTYDEILEQLKILRDFLLPPDKDR